MRQPQEIQFMGGPRDGEVVQVPVVKTASPDELTAHKAIVGTQAVVNSFLHAAARLFFGIIGVLVLMSALIIGFNTSPVGVIMVMVFVVVPIWAIAWYLGALKRENR